MSDDKLAQWRAWLSRHGHKLAWIALGMLLGVLASVARSCAATDAHDGHAASAGHEEKSAVWTCAMHPQIRKSEPGQCPICGMDLIPVDTEEGDDDNRVVLSERAKTLAMLRTSPVRRQTNSTSDLRLLGRVEANEKTLRTITAWTAGRIDRLQVNVTGVRVGAGQVIATLYSPEVFAAHQDLLVAKEQIERMSSAADSARSAASAALDATRKRLGLLGVPGNEIARMETQDSPTRAVQIRTPFGGTVIERMATEGAYVTTGTPLYRIADLNSVWIQLDAYEGDLSRVAVGQRVQIEVEAFPGEQLEGEVTFVDPTIDERRRTARVRVEVENRDGRLKPGMFAQAIVHAETPSGTNAPLVIPDTAPLFTGRRALVYIEVADGERSVYEPRQVRLGPRLGHMYPVVSGLSEGERVVTRGAFAIDADLQIRGGASMMSGPDDLDSDKGAITIEVPRDQLARLSPVVVAYLAVQGALADDALARAHTAALELESAIPQVQIERPSEAKQAWSDLAQALRRDAREVAQAKVIEHARSGFERLSNDIAKLLRRFGNPLDQALVEARCPMAFGTRGATWVQRDADLENAYLGESMRTCGEVQYSIEPGARLHDASQPHEPAKSAPAKSAPAKSAPAKSAPTRSKSAPTRNAPAKTESAAPTNESMPAKHEHAPAKSTAHPPGHRH